MKEYAIYPFTNINITQNYDEGNHINHWKNSNNYTDLPWDEAGKDSNKEYFAPQNDFIIEEVFLSECESILTDERIRRLYAYYQAIYKNMSTK